MDNYSAETHLFQIDPRSPAAAVIEQAAAVIRAGGLVAFPTETVYGLGANALDADAVGRIFAAKGRPSSDPLIVHIAETESITQIARDVPPLAFSLAQRFWAGALTLVLPRAEVVPPNVSAGRDTVAVRMPAHAVALALIRAAGVPIAAPSANLFSHPSPTTAAHVLQDLRGRVDMILDGGATTIGVESTILDLTDDPPRILRPGGVSLEALREVIPNVQHIPRFLAVEADETPAAPGMLLKHYSPRAELLLFRGQREAVLRHMRETLRHRLSQGQRVGLMLRDDEQPTFDGFEVDIAALGAHPEDHARALFAAMRELDQRGMDVILVGASTQEGLGLAIWDRLLRAAEGHVIDVDDQAHLR